MGIELNSKRGTHMVIVDPSALGDAAASLGSLGTSLEEAGVLAELPTTGILAPADDEVSSMITTLFNSHGQWYQQTSWWMASKSLTVKSVRVAGWRAAPTMRQPRPKNNNGVCVRVRRRDGWPGGPFGSRPMPH